MMKIIFIIIVLFLTSCNKNADSTSEKIKKIKLTNKEKKQFQDSIIKIYSKNGAKKFSYISQMTEWQTALDKGLEVDSTIAYLWQQKAMPYFKAKKYEVGMQYIDQAVKYNREEYQPYRAFIKCIFSKRYKEAILDFEDCIKRYGDNYVMDHTYNFYIAISYLQLNEFENAELLLESYVNENFKNLGEEWGHPTALFYLGISKFELKKYSEAIHQFDRALNLHPDLLEAYYYKMICLKNLNEKEKVKECYNKFSKAYKLGYSINEDNAIYETYPYQLRLKQ